MRSVRRFPRSRGLHQASRVVTGRRHSSFLSQSAYERLEDRALMAVVELADRTPMFDGAEQQMAYGMVTSGTATDLEWDVVIPSKGSETILLELSGNVRISEMSAGDPEGAETSTWQRLTGTPNAYQLDETWIAGTVSAGEGARHVYFKVHPVNQTTSLWSPSVRAYFQLPWIDRPTSDSPPLSLDFGWNEAQASEQANFIGILRPDNEVATIDGLASSWQLSHSDSLAFLEPLPVEDSDGNELTLRTPRVPDEMVEQFDGIWVDYESQTGRLQVRSSDASPLSALEIKSDDGLFVGPAPQFTFPNPFNIYSPNKLFTFTLPPFSKSALDFGPVLQTGLSRGDLATKLQFDGAYSEGGRFGKVVVSVDGDLPFDEALKFAFGRKTGDRLAVSAETKLDLSQGVDHLIDLQYRWDDSGGGTNMSRHQASVEYRYSTDSDWSPLMEIKACPDVCFLSTAIEDYSGPLHLRIANRSNDTSLSITSLIVESHKQSLPFRVGLDVEVDEMLMGFSESSASRVLDEDGNVVVSNAISLQLGGPIRGTDHYQWETSPETPLVFLHMGRASIADRPAFKPSFSLYLNKVESYLGSPIDERVCDLKSITWDGPAFSSATYSNGSIQLGYLPPLEPRMYTVHVPEKACRLASGSWIAAGDYPVDYQPPQLVDVPLQDAGVLPQGLTSIAMEFDEPISSVTYFGDITDWKGWGSIESSEGVRYLIEPIQVEQEQKRLMLPIGNLPVGEYTLKVNELSVFDRYQNIGKHAPMSISFRVSDLAADLERAVFDLDLNGVTDSRDLRMFSSSIYTQQLRFTDLNHDGAWNEWDVDVWIEQSRLFPMGDVNFDGVFNQRDLDILAFNELDIPATRRMGDFDADGFYTTADLTLAMQGGLSELEDEAV